MRVEGGGSDNVDIGFLYFFLLLFSLFKAYLILFGLFLPQTEERKKNQNTWNSSWGVPELFSTRPINHKNDFSSSKWIPLRNAQNKISIHS